MGAALRPSDLPPAPRAKALRCWPPQPVPAHTASTTKSGQDQPKPERRTIAEECARFVRDWCKAHGLNAAALNEITTITVSLCARKLAGELDVGLRDLRKFPPRYRREFILAFDAWCDVEERRALAHSNHG